MLDHAAFQQLLAGMRQFDASDLHLKVGYNPYYRVAGDLRKIDFPPIESSQQIEHWITPLVPEKKKDDFTTKGDVDFSYAVPGGDRFRINLFRAGELINVAIRRVSNRIPSFDDLHLPPIYKNWIEKAHEGLILISGVTGCGKSCTMAALLDHINHTRSAHIITIEDPVEFVFMPARSIISQRELGLDVADYDEALKYVVRQDPDVIFIGELRDGRTMLAAIQAAETGHLVMGSIHCADAPQAFSRILEYFPRNQHEFIRSSLSNSLSAILCQKLLPAIEESIKRVPATEVLLANAMVRDMIRRGEDESLSGVIENSVEDGMRNFTLSLGELIENELVYYDTAMKYAPNKEALASAVQGIKTTAKGLVSRLGKR
jgi:twitching motility protein PilT